jgi:nitrite reductase (NADH) large subunit
MGHAERAAVPAPAGHPAAWDKPPVVVIGAGPVGVRFVQELHRRAPATHIVIFGAESWAPYNRVRLSAALAGETSWATLASDVRLPESPSVEARFGCAIESIDRASQIVRDTQGREQRYSRLVLAVGSAPHVPGSPGITLPGVFTFRDMNDAQSLLARRMRSRTTVVLGGGLLGLEAARAMRRFNTEVWVVEHLDRLMSRQLDTAGGALLKTKVEAEGINVVLGDGLTRVLGGERVEGVKLRSGREIPCDTLVVATGIRPNTDIALRAGLVIGRAVRVDDLLRTSDPLIQAIGECAEHRDRLYGIVAPGLEQAAVAAHVVAGGQAAYTGTHAATRLKVMSCPVFSIGDTGNEGLTNMGRAVVYSDPAKGIYRKLVVTRGRLTGAIAVGELEELSRIQEAVTARRRVFPWHLFRFTRRGRLWEEKETQSVLNWPAEATVCNCTGVTRGALGRALAEGCATAAALSERTGASTVCGSCRPLLIELAGSAAAADPVRGWKVLLGASSVALKTVALLALILLVPYAATVQVPWQWDMLWRENFWKQVSGYSVLALTVLLLVMSLRKRIKRFTIGDFPLWRVAHVVLGALTLAGLAVHTGGRMGSNLNFLLMTAFLGAVFIGAVAGGVIALEHRLGTAAVRLRRNWLWSHILIAWPIPVLLGFHVLKTYYF